jgi:YesN/AraC family two-component response regulator
VNYIDEEYINSNLGLALIASKFNISEGYVSTIFKGSMGVNFADYVEKVRIDSACNLLENSNDTINTISEKVGYNSVQSFRRAFKKVKGISPKELRNMNK